MNWLKQKKQSEEVSYWQTIADALAALLMIVLLILMVLVLYIVRVPEDDFVDSFAGDHYQRYMDPDAGAGDYGSREYDSGKARYWEQGDQKEGEGYNREINGGGGGGGVPTDPTEETHGEGEGSDKAAVYVMVLDAETERTIKKAGIRFELYDDRETLQILNTYYPKKVEYRTFDTTADGVFYLPEKLSMGGYRLHELTTPAGYDTAEPLEMKIAESYDWPEPFVARVLLSPSKNIIRIQLKDRSTGSNLGGAAYDVIAAEDILTMDGTLRYPKDTLVCTIDCDSSGSGESQALYLGKYLLQERTVPQYYARDLEQTEVRVEKKSGNQLPSVHTLTNERTTVVLTAADELYGNQSLSGVSFSLSRDGSAQAPQTMVTDAYGQILLSELQKGSAYTVRQLTAAEGYSALTEPIHFRVSEDGRVEDETYHEIFLSNRTLRAAISVKGAVLQNHAADYNVALYDGENRIVDVWDSSGMAHVAEGLQPGDYYIRINGQEKTQKHILIQDEKEIQRFSCSVWTTADIGAAAMLGAFAVGILAVLPFFIHSKTKRAKSEQRQTEEVNHHGG